MYKHTCFMSGTAIYTKDQEYACFIFGDETYHISEEWKNQADADYGTETAYQMIIFKIMNDRDRRKSQ